MLAPRSGSFQAVLSYDGILRCQDIDNRIPKREAVRSSPCSSVPSVVYDFDFSPVSVRNDPPAGVILPPMKAKGLTPILNVSDIAASFAWFEKWDWRKCWDWGTPATFGAVGSGECEIFLCQGAQGGRGRGANTTTFQQDGDEQADKGSWMSVWVDDVDEVHTQCVAAGLEITFPPTDMPWNVREMHLRHPDGHVFRVSRGNERD